MKTLLLFLFFSFSLSAQKYPKINIDIEKIDSVEIVKIYLKKKTNVKSKKLSEKQAKDFAQKWNDAKIFGADKYKGEFYLMVYLKDKVKRGFIIMDNRVQESGWTTFEIGDKLYFDKIWNSVK